jgi:ABC-2 type transport system permease protein
MTAFVEIVSVTFRQLLGRRRTLLLLLLASLPLFLAVVTRAFGEVDVDDFTGSVFDVISMTIVLPLAAVLFGCGAFGAEQDEGTVIYLLAKPLPRWLLVAAKATAAALLAATLSVASILVAALVAVVPAGSRGVEVTEAYVGAMVVGALCYVALFVALSLFTKRALVLAIGYTLVWEGVLSSLLPGIANLSVRQYALGVAGGFAHLSVEPARLPPSTALTLSVILIGAALAVAVWRLQRLELSGGTD